MTPALVGGGPARRPASEAIATYLLAPGHFADADRRLWSARHQRTDRRRSARRGGRNEPLRRSHASDLGHFGSAHTVRDDHARFRPRSLWINEAATKQDLLKAIFETKGWDHERRTAPIQRHQQTHLAGWTDADAHSRLPRNCAERCQLGATSLPRVRWFPTIACGSRSRGSPSLSHGRVWHLDHWRLCPSPSWLFDGRVVPRVVHEPRVALAARLAIAAGDRHLVTGAARPPSLRALTARFTGLSALHHADSRDAPPA